MSAHRSRRSPLSRYGNAADVWVKIDPGTYERRGWFLRRFPGHEDWAVVDPRGAITGGFPALGKAKAHVDRALGPPALTPAVQRALVTVAKGHGTLDDIAKLKAAGLVETYRYYKPGFRHESRGVKLTTRGRELAAGLGDRRRATGR